MSDDLSEVVGAMSLAELGKITECPVEDILEFYPVTVSEFVDLTATSVVALVQFCRGRKHVAQAVRQPETVKAPKPTKPSAAKPRPAAPTGPVDTKTEEGKQAYEAKLLAYLKGQNSMTGAGELLAHMGGSAKQLRARLAVLMERKEVETQGERRGTKYWASSPDGRPLNTSSPSTGRHQVPLALPGEELDRELAAPLGRPPVPWPEPAQPKPEAEGAPEGPEAAEGAPEGPEAAEGAPEAAEGAPEGPEAAEEGAPEGPEAEGAPEEPKAAEGAPERRPRPTKTPTNKPKPGRGGKRRR